MDYRYYHKNLLGFILLLLSITDLCADKITKPWTFLVYMARDNSLSDFGTVNINEMKVVNNPQVNILVYDCHSFNGQKVAQKLLITCDSVKVLETIPNVDSGSETTFTQACLWALQDFPSDKFAVVAWNHGSGMLNRLPSMDNYLMRGFCYDDTTGNYLDDIKIMRSLETIVKFRNGKKVDLFGFDACLMADVEIIAALAPYVSYVVASQETIPGDGWNYTGLLSWQDNQILTPATFAGYIVKAYENYYKTTTESFTLAAISTIQFDTLNKAVDSLGTILSNLLTSPNDASVKAAIDRCLNNYFDEATYLDLYDFCTHLYVASGRAGITNKNSLQELQDALVLCMKTLKTMILFSTKSISRAPATGLSIYFPQLIIEPSYLKTFFAQHSAWVNFISTYINS